MLMLVMMVSLFRSVVQVKGNNFLRVWASAGSSVRRSGCSEYLLGTYGVVSQASSLTLRAIDSESECDYCCQFQSILHIKGPHFHFVLHYTTSVTMPVQGIRAVATNRVYAPPQPPSPSPSPPSSPLRPANPPSSPEWRRRIHPPVQTARHPLLRLVGQLSRNEVNNPLCPLPPLRPSAYPYVYNN
jgi:hypothetical protein